MFLHEKINQINERLKVLSNVSNIVIWGAGMHTCRLFELTDISSYPIEDIVDINRDKRGNPCFGFIVKNPEDIVWNHMEAVVISVPGKEAQIVDMLTEKCGFSGKIIRLYEQNEITPFYLLYDKKNSGIQWVGDYDSWESVYQECTGYEDRNVIDTVIGAVEKVVNGEASWERDGYLFYEPKYNYPICACILKCALQNKKQGGKVRILDIGGSLGSTYFQNRKYLDRTVKLEWVVAEQDAFVQYGKEHLEDGTLSFIKSSNNYAEYDRFDIVLLSGSLEYISEYEEILSKIIEAKPNYIILDRIFIGDRARICKQIMSKYIYTGSYPVRIFRESDISNFFSPDYEMVEKDVSSADDAPVYFADGKAVLQYFVWKLTESK